MNSHPSWPRSPTTFSLATSGSGPELSKRDRSLITVAALIATYRTDQIRLHIRRALQNGVTKEEIGEVITHLAFYSGWPTAANAITVAKEVFDEA